MYKICQMLVQKEGLALYLGCTNQNKNWSSTFYLSPKLYIGLNKLNKFLEFMLTGQKFIPVGSPCWSPVGGSELIQSKSQLWWQVEGWTPKFCFDGTP